MNSLPEVVPGHPSCSQAHAEEDEALESYQLSVLSNHSRYAFGLKTEN